MVQCGLGSMEKRGDWRKNDGHRDRIKSESFLVCTSNGCQHKQLPLCHNHEKCRFCLDWKLQIEETTEGLELLKALLLVKVFAEKVGRCLEEDCFACFGCFWLIMVDGRANLWGDLWRLVK